MSCKDCEYVKSQHYYSPEFTNEVLHYYCCGLRFGNPKVNPTLDTCNLFKKKKDELATSKEEIEMHKAPIVIQEAPLEESKYDPVSHPDHYTAGRKFEPKDVIRDWGLNFNLGNAVKYISRAGRKNDLIEDLKKARQYLDFEIEYLEKKFGERF